MCVIGICQTQRIQKPEFFEAFRCNKDGGGMAWRENGNIRFVKGIMKVEEMWACYNDLIKEDNFPHIVHFRVGSPVCQGLTHPFLVTEESDLFLNYEGKDRIVFHNGVVTSWKSSLLPLFLAIRKIPDGEWSDTRMIACIMSLLGEKALETIDGKWVTFSPTELNIYGDWNKEENGIIWSNGTYKLSSYQQANWKKQHYNHQTGKWETNDDDSEWDKRFAGMVGMTPDEPGLEKVNQGCLEYGRFTNMESLGSSLEFVL